MRNIFFSAVIFSGLVAIPASAVNFDFGADAVSRYVWRGGDAGDDSPAIQPAISATWLDGSLETGYWGSYSIASGATGPEIDSYITYHAGPISISLTDAADCVRSRDCSRDSYFSLYRAI